MCMHIFQWGDRDYAAKAVVLQRADEAHQRNDYWETQGCVISYVISRNISPCFQMSVNLLSKSNFVTLKKLYEARSANFSSVRYCDTVSCGISSEDSQT